MHTSWKKDRISLDSATVCSSWEKISQFHTRGSLPTKNGCFCIVRCFLPPLYFFFSLFGGLCAASQSLSIDWRDVDLWMWDPGVDRSMTRSIHHRSTHEKPHKKRKILCFEEHVLKKKLGQCFFLWEETEGNRFIAGGPSFNETKNLWFFSHLSWLHFAAELKGKLHF